VQDGRELTLAGSTVLRFDGEGRVVEHVDYWVEADGRMAPFRVGAVEASPDLNGIEHLPGP
jgi:hypothetical protein